MTTAKYYVGSSSAFGEWKGTYYNYEADGKRDAFRMAKVGAARRCFDRDCKEHKRGAFVCATVSIRYRGRIIARWKEGRRVK